MANNKGWWQRHAPWSFLNTSEEWHAFVIGWAETTCPWWARYRVTKEAEYTPAKEYHYYAFGRVMGLLTLLAMIIGFAKLAMVIL